MADGDDRGAIYSDLHQGQLTTARDKNALAARRFLDIALGYFEAKSVLDVGCGLGTWLAVAQEMGLEVAGVEGPWCEAESLEIDKRLVTITDLENPINLQRKFDLAISLEVGEHLSKEAAPHLIQTLTTHADHVMFSAAVPFQGGHHHVNEQFHCYWIDQFERRGYVAIDLFRGAFWDDKTIHWWLRQNVLLFVRAETLEANAKLKAESLVKRPLDIILPWLYYSRVMFGLNQAKQMQEALRLLYLGKAKLRETPEGIVVDAI